MDRSSARWKAASKPSVWLRLRRYAPIVWVLVTAVLLIQNLWLPRWEWLGGWEKTYQAVLGMVVMFAAFAIANGLYDLYRRESCAPSVEQPPARSDGRSREAAVRRRRIPSARRGRNGRG